MATRRMFSKTIIDSDEFLEMPVSARLLYFDLGMRADDDGFVSPKRIMKFTNSTDDDLKVLLAKKYVLNFENKVLVIRDWKVNNFIRPDRYTPTIYQEYLKRLQLTSSNQYQLHSGLPDDIPLGDPELGKDRLGKGRKELGKDNIPTKVGELVLYFFELKGWIYVKGEKSSQKVFHRFLRPAKELLELCNDNLDEAKFCLKKVADWAKSRKLDWSIETVFKKWYEIDSLRELEKKPYVDGNRAYQYLGKWYLIMPNGEKKEYVGDLGKVIYK